MFHCSSQEGGAGRLMLTRACRNQPGNVPQATARHMPPHALANQKQRLHELVRGLAGRSLVYAQDCQL